ncbi:MAG: hypothetical protein QGD90_11790 [Candidatus Hydrogenedentes bacterium]|nr:hypothetical protein [Candidatus Hydrogenedentota bacterium]
MKIRSDLRSLALLLVSALSTLAACTVTAPGIGYVGGWDWNVSDETERWAGFDPDGIYRLQRDVFLLDIPDRTNGLALVPGMESVVPPGTVRGPTALSDYQDAPRHWPRVAGVAEEGTRMRATILRSKGNVRAPSLARVYIKAQIMAGPHQGKVVDLQALSLYATDLESGRAELVGPNEDFLSRAP